MQPELIEPDRSIPRAIPAPEADLSRVEGESRLGYGEVVAQLVERHAYGCRRFEPVRAHWGFAVP